MWEKEFSEDIIIERHLVEVLVACETEDDAIELLDILAKKGYRWASGTKIDPNESCWNVYGRKTYYEVNPKTRSLLYGNVGGRYESTFDNNRKFIYRSTQSFREPSKDDVMSFLGVG